MRKYRNGDKVMLEKAAEVVSNDEMGLTVRVGDIVLSVSPNEIIMVRPSFHENDKVMIGDQIGRIMQKLEEDTFLVRHAGRAGAEAYSVASSSMLEHAEDETKDIAQPKVEAEPKQQDIDPQESENEPAAESEPAETQEATPQLIESSDAPDEQNLSGGENSEAPLNGTIHELELDITDERISPAASDDSMEDTMAKMLDGIRPRPEQGRLDDLGETREVRAVDADDDQQ